MKAISSDLTHEDVDRILDIVNKIDDVDLQITVGELTLHVRKGNPGVVSNCEVGHAPRSTGNAQVEQSDSQSASVDSNKSGAENGRVQAVVPASRVDSHAEGTADMPRDESDLVDIVAPMIGRFYSRPSPNEPCFIEVGSKVAAEDSVCILEVMKLFNTVRAGVQGEIIEVLVQDGQMVEEGDALFRVKPQ